MQKIAVLGAGRVGNAIIRDLSDRFSILAYDRDEEALEKLKNVANVKSKQVDIQEIDLSDLLQGYELIISAVPGFMGYRTLERIISCGKNVVDISFFPEDPLNLDILAKEKKVTAVVDCGVAPGMGNIILGRYNEEVQIDSYECLVGGLPIKRDWPYQYKAVFSPIDVIEEYIRPARFIKSGKMITREALSDPELVDFEEIGTLESFNTDGLRTLMTTMDIPDMIEKTMRYPGTIDYLKVLRETGFFSYDPVIIDNQKIKPIDLTAKLLFPIWKQEEGDADLTVMRITIKGMVGEKRTEITYNLYDTYDFARNISSMARTTGFTCTAVASLIMDQKYEQHGINPPEFLGRKESDYTYILNYLKDRKVIYQKEERLLD